VFLYAFEESVNCNLLSSFCDDSNLRISLFKHLLSTMGVSKESINLLIDSLLTPIVESTYYQVFNIHNFGYNMVINVNVHVKVLRYFLFCNQHVMNFCVI